MDNMDDMGKGGANKPPAYTSDSSDTIAMVLEILFGLFGIMGMGWLYAKNVKLALLIFFGFIVLVFIEMFIFTITFGFAACIIFPFNLVLAIVSGLKVRDYVRNTDVEPSFAYVAIGVLVGAVLMCGGFFGILGGQLFLRGLGAG